jgi:hypothetical protein
MMQIEVEECICCPFSTFDYCEYPMCAITNKHLEHKDDFTSDCPLIGNVIRVSRRIDELNKQGGE